MRGRDAGPERQPNSSLPSGGNFRQRERREGGGAAGRWFPPEAELRARGLGTRGERGDRAALLPLPPPPALPPPSARLGLPRSLPSWLAPAARRRRRARRACAGRGVGGERKFQVEGSSAGWRLLDLLGIMAERAASPSRPAAPAGGPGDSSSPATATAAPAPVASRGHDSGRAVDRPAHLQGRVRAAGGYRSVRRRGGSRSRPGRRCGRRRWMLGLSACTPWRQSGRLLGLPASTVFFFFFFSFFR